MLLDKELELSNSQAVTASAKSTNTIYLGPNSFGGNANGSEREIPLVVDIEESATAAGAATVVFTVRSSENADMSSPVEHYSTPAIGKADLVAGQVPAALKGLAIPIDAGPYVDVYFTVATGPLTAGKFTIRGGAGRGRNIGY
jgi:hypothetical protein